MNARSAVPRHCRPAICLLPFIMADSFLEAALQRSKDAEYFGLMESWAAALSELKPLPVPASESAEEALGRKWKKHKSRPLEGVQFHSEALKKALIAGKTSFGDDEFEAYGIKREELNYLSWISCETAEDPYCWYTPMPVGPQLQVIEIQSLGEAKGRQAMLDALCKDGAIIFKPFSPPASADIFSHCFDSVHKFNALPSDLKVKAAPVRGTPPHGYVATPSMEVFASKVHLKKGYVWPEVKASSNKYGQSKAKTFAEAVTQSQQMLASTARTVLGNLMDVLNFDGRARTNLRHLVDLETAGFEYTGHLDLNPNMATCSHSGLTIFSHTTGKPMGWATDDSLLSVCPPSTEAMIKIRMPNGVEWFPEMQLKPGTGEMLVYAGEALSYLTCGKIAALMWCLEPKTKPVPGALEGSGDAVTPGMSGVFRARCVRRADSMLFPTPPMQPLAVRAFEAYGDEQKRQHWPWRKHSQYFTPGGGQYLYTPPPAVGKQPERKKPGIKKGFLT